MQRGIWLVTGSRRRLLPQKVLLCLATFGLVGGVGLAQAGSASATPFPPSTSNCTYSNATTPANPLGVKGVTPGSTISILCAPGSFPAATTFVVVEASGLAGVVSPASDQIGEVDASSLTVAGSGADGSLSATFTVPTTFAAGDPNAACPPTQAQINVGLACTLVIVAISNLQPQNEAMLLYTGQGTPNAPTFRATFHVSHGVKTLTASDVPGACPTPPTASSHCWWGAPVTGAPNPTAFSGIPPLEAQVSKLITSGTLAVSPAVYCQPNATAAACANVPVGTLIPPALSGTVTTKLGLQPFVINEPNTTPYPGNGTLKSLIPATVNVGARETGLPVRV